MATPAPILSSTSPTPLPPVSAPAGVSPTLVGLLRGLVYAVAAAAVPAVVAFMESVDAGDLGSWGPFLPFLLLAARMLEGRVDKSLGQARQVATGGRPAEPTAYLVTNGHGGNALAAVAPLPEPEPVGIGDALAGAGTTSDAPAPLPPILLTVAEARDLVRAGMARKLTPATVDRIAAGLVDELVIAVRAGTPGPDEMALCEAVVLAGRVSMSTADPIVDAVIGHLADVARSVTPSP